MVGCRSVNGSWLAPERVVAGLKWVLAVMRWAGGVGVKPPGDPVGKKWQI